MALNPNCYKELRDLAHRQINSSVYGVYPHVSDADKQRVAYALLAALAELEEKNNPEKGAHFRWTFLRPGRGGKDVVFGTHTDQDREVIAQCLAISDRIAPEVLRAINGGVKFKITFEF
jgi:hypothetical protein